MKIEHEHVHVHVFTHSNAHCKKKIVQHFPISLINIFLNNNLTFKTRVFREITTWNFTMCC